MKFILISDTHNQHNNISLPKGDVLIHAGDATGRGSECEVEDFAYWMGQQDFKHKIFIPGNHDWLFQRDEQKARSIMNSSCTVLIDQEYNIDYKLLDKNGNTINKKIKIWGSPWQPFFCDWAFNLRTRDELRDVWAKIPDDTDILITHGPPYNMLDECIDGRRVGCKELWSRIMNVKPKLHVFGHIHESSGQDRFDNIDFVNASQLNHRYAYTNQPVHWEWDYE